MNIDTQTSQDKADLTDFRIITHVKEEFSTIRYFAVSVEVTDVQETHQLDLVVSETYDFNTQSTTVSLCSIEWVSPEPDPQKKASIIAALERYFKSS